MKEIFGITKSIDCMSIIEICDYLDQESLYDNMSEASKRSIRAKKALMKSIAGLIAKDVDKRMRYIPELNNENAVKMLKFIYDLIDKCGNKIILILDYDPSKGCRESDYNEPEFNTDMSEAPAIIEINYDLAYSNPQLPDLNEYLPLDDAEIKDYEDRQKEYNQWIDEAINYREANLDAALLYEDLSSLKFKIHREVNKLEEKITFLGNALGYKVIARKMTLRDFIIAEDKESVLSIFKRSIHASNGSKGKSKKVALSILALAELNHIDIATVNRSDFYEAIRIETREQIGTNSAINYHLNLHKTYSDLVRKEIEIFWN